LKREDAKVKNFTAENAEKTQRTLRKPQLLRALRVFSAFSAVNPPIVRVNDSQT
jgi:hypothetical protein